MFSVKAINLDTNHDLYAIINQGEADKLGLSSGERVKIFETKNRKNYIICELEILQCLDKNVCPVILKKEEIGLVNGSYRKLNLQKGAKVSVLPSSRATSVDFVRKKFLGKGRLSEGEFKEILCDITNNKYSDVETTFFVLACMANLLDDKETIALTKAMVGVGKELNFKESKNDVVVDKHCIGGVPGNRTTMIVIPIIAAAGLKIPKTSSRSITSPSGTADTMEVLANVSISIDEMHRIVQKTGGCLAWGGALGLSPADDIIINVEHPLEIDSEGQMIASVLSKKKSAGSTHVLIDIPVGAGAKVKSKVDGLRLKRRFEKVGKAVGLHVEVILSDGSQPIGRGIGPALEAEDVLRVLRNDTNCPKRLKTKSIFMAGLILEMGGVVRKGLGSAMAKHILESGEALEKFEEIRDEQGRNPDPKKAKYVEEIYATKSGHIHSINNKRVAKLAFVLGAPKDKEAGVYINKIVGDSVKKGDCICQIHSDSHLKLKFGKAYYEEHRPFTIE